MSKRFARVLLDLAAPGRTSVKSAFRTKCRPRLATLVPEGDIAALAAEHDISPATEHRAAAQEGPLVQAAIRAKLRALLAALLAIFDLAAKAAKCNFRFRMMLVRYSDVLFVGTSSHRQQPGRQAWQQQA